MGGEVFFKGCQCLCEHCKGRMQSFVINSRLTVFFSPRTDIEIAHKLAMVSDAMCEGYFFSLQE